MIIKEKLSEKCTSPQDVASVLQKILLSDADETDRMREHFWIIGFDSRRAVSYVELCSLGTLSSSIVHPREVFRLAILKSADSIILGHNHPSGDVGPSREDILVTNRMIEAGKLIGIPIEDHVIINTNADYYSLREQNRCNFN